MFPLGPTTGGFASGERGPDVNPLPAGSIQFLNAPPAPPGTRTRQRLDQPTVIGEATDHSLPYGPGAGRIIMRPPIFGGYQGLQG